MGNKLDLTHIQDKHALSNVLYNKILDLNNQVKALEASSNPLNKLKLHGARQQLNIALGLFHRLFPRNSKNQDRPTFNIDNLPKNIRENDLWAIMEKAAELDINDFQKEFTPLFRFDKTGENLDGIAGPASKSEAIGVQALKDWNRLSKNIRINGETVDKICNGKKFENVDELKDFIEKHLLKHITDKLLLEGAAQECLNILHQSGLMLATNAVLFRHLAPLAVGGIIINQPTPHINLSPTKNGILVYEKETYDRQTNSKTGKATQLKGGNFHIQTKTTSSITWVANEKDEVVSTIKVKEISTRCNNATVREKIPIAGKPESLFEAICRYLSHTIGNTARTISNAMPSFSKEKKQQTTQEEPRSGPRTKS